VHTDQGWQYRITKRTERFTVDEPGSVYELRQVFVDENDDVVHFDNNVLLAANSIESLINHINKIRKSTWKPVLDFNTGEEV